MEKPNHYQLLEIDKKASKELIQLAYDRLISDTKEKLGDSPLFHTKKDHLNAAYKILMSPISRQVYDEKLVQEQFLADKKLNSNNLSSQSSKKHRSMPKTSKNNSIADSPLVFISNLIFSKSFLGALIIIIILILTIPSGRDRVINEAIQTQYELHNKRIEIEQQRYQDRVSS